ncbi:MAG: alanine racemase [Akkermansiaceae bacterium]
MSSPEISDSPPRSWVEINLSNLRHNLSVARNASGCEIMAVVKAGAYGHGLEKISAVMESEGIAFLGVANVGEARRIQNSGVKLPIYLLGATWEQEREEIVRRNLTPCISTLEEAASFNQIAKRLGINLPVHLAIDTGMGRGGFLPDELLEKVTKLLEYQSLSFEGIASHLSSSDEDKNFTAEQIEIFTETVGSLDDRLDFKWKHLFNSGGILGYPKTICNLARPGLMIYGVSPLEQYQRQLKTVMSLKSRVSLVRTVPKGHSISYGHTFVTDRPTRIATVGIGYGDGFPRLLSGKGARVSIRNTTHPIVGRVTMDQIVVRLPDNSEVKTGDEVELFGEEIPVTEIAMLAETIPWEIFTGITPRVKRRYLGQ